MLIGHRFQFDDEFVGRAQGLRWIQSLTTGTDTILKLAALRPEVTVTSTRGMHGPQMSELVFLHTLALARDFPRMQRNQAAGRWERWPQPLLAGKTVVIVGVGAIAEALAPRCMAFGMTVMGLSGSTRVPAAQAMQRARHFWFGTHNPSLGPMLEWGRRGRHSPAWATATRAATALRFYDAGTDSAPEEPCFAPKRADGPEGEGWLLTMAGRRRENCTDLVILDAAQLEHGPVATVKCPCRLHEGFHGTRVSERALIR